MKSYIGVGVSVGVLAGIWTQVSVELGLITWVAFVSWALFFAAGGGRDGAVTTLVSNLSGVFWGWLLVTALAVATFPGALAIGVALIAFIMCVQAGIAKPLSMIPAAFIGTAIYFGSVYSFWPTVISVVIGVALGWASAVSGEMIQGKITKPVSPELIHDDGSARPQAA